MKTYRIYASINGSRCLGTVEAKSKKEAELKAWDELDTSVSLCHYCSDQIEDPEVSKLIVEEEE